jgi:hypothetical protein
MPGVLVCRTPILAGIHAVMVAQVGAPMGAVQAACRMKRAPAIAVMGCRWGVWRLRVVGRGWMPVSPVPAWHVRRCLMLISKGDIVAVSDSLCKRTSQSCLTRKRLGHSDIAISLGPCLSLRKKRFMTAMTTLTLCTNPALGVVISRQEI